MRYSIQNRRVEIVKINLMQHAQQNEKTSKKCPTLVDLFDFTQHNSRQITKDGQ
jgi:hypothetical protein